jgi:DNA-binding transcriptional MocR family regulator
MEEIAGWRDRSGPLTMRLAGALRDAIARGDLPAGRRLPPERMLATSLGISRSTAVAAYERLADEGWLDRLQGSGTFVAAVELPAPAEPGPNPIFGRMIEGGGPVIDLTVAAPAATPAVGPALRAAALDAARFTGGHGYFTAGLPGLRQEVARLLRRAGVPATADEVLITAGCQQAIALVASALLEPGDPVLVESPTFPGALDAFRSAGARLAAVQLTEAGLRAGDIELALNRTRPRLVYLTPTFNNPTGTLLPAADRARLAQLAAEFQVPMVEDLTVADLAFDAVPPQPVAASPGGVVVTVGSASKLFWGGLRVGWVRAPRHLVERLARLKAVADIGTSVPSQLAAARLLPQAEEVRERRRDELRGRRDLLVALLEELLPAWTWRLPAGGVSLWARLPGGGAAEFAAVALRHGVAVVPGPYFAPPGAGLPWADRLRLPFTLEGPQLETGVRRLARAWQDHQRAARHPAVPHRAVV